MNEALQTFDEDKTGRADFALEALGGNVISIGCTGTVSVHSLQYSSTFTVNTHFRFQFGDKQWRKSVHGIGGDNSGILAIFSKIQTLRGMTLI